MKAFPKLLAAIACIALSMSAHAGIYKMDFTFTDFYDSGYQSSLQAPQNTVTGTFTYEAATMYDVITKANAFDMTIAGFTYGVSDIALGSSSLFFGGAYMGSNTINSTVDDFWLGAYSASAGTVGYMDYTTHGGSSFFSSRKANIVITDVSNAVPEPGSIALLLVGAMGLGLASRRVKR
jgi:hypothetical protein